MLVVNMDAPTMTHHTDWKNIMDRLLVLTNKSLLKILRNFTLVMQGWLVLVSEDIMLNMIEKVKFCVGVGCVLKKDLEWKNGLNFQIEKMYQSLSRELVVLECYWFHTMKLSNNMK